MSDKLLDAPYAAADRLPASLVLLLAGASAFSVANVYYAQPLLDAIAADFGISLAAVGMVITVTQLGCALALLLVVPLGDRVNRRQLLAAQQLLLIAALLAVGWSNSSLLLLAGMLLVGLLGTAMTQGLIAFAATLAAPHERGRVVGAAQGGWCWGCCWRARFPARWRTSAAGARCIFSPLGSRWFCCPFWRACCLHCRRHPKRSAIRPYCARC
ncbi:Arabinose efflux permease [Serratia entomophila]|nr:Arabinose efflux permease [Serratia entomophila]